MHQYAERRRPQPFGARRPLLERQVWAVGRRDRARAELFGHRADDLAGPAVEGILEVFRLALAPFQEMRPWRRAGLADQQHGCREIAGGAGWRSFAVAE